MLSIRIRVQRINILLDGIAHIHFYVSCAVCASIDMCLHVLNHMEFYQKPLWLYIHHSPHRRIKSMPKASQVNNALFYVVSHSLQLFRFRRFTFYDLQHSNAVDIWGSICHPFTLTHTHTPTHRDTPTSSVYVCEFSNAFSWCQKNFCLIAENKQAKAATVHGIVYLRGLIIKQLVALFIKI